jgi:hypothetical protein
MAITSSEEAKISNRQPDAPCHDCPWRRDAPSGWLGGLSAQEWIAEAHGEARIDCHTVNGDPQPQCAGAAIYRANVCKRVRDPEAVHLKADRKTVFSNPNEFKEHHEIS